MTKKPKALRTVSAAAGRRAEESEPAEAPPDRLPISALVPLEGAVIRSAVAEYRERLKNGDSPPVRVERVEGEWLVVDGNNRTYAAKLEGREEVAVDVRNTYSAMLASRRDMLRRALQRGRKGFDNVAVVEDADERATFIEAEDASDREAEFYRSLGALEAVGGSSGGDEEQGDWVAEDLLQNRDEPAPDSTRGESRRAGEDEGTPEQGN